jgi:aminoglycoside 2'-N-acetyltransferase I
VIAVRRVRSPDLTPRELGALRAIFVAAWPEPDEAFDEYDLEHAMGGLHFVADIGGAIVSHASVVEREIHAGEHRLRTGYVEAVATHPEHQRRGYGSAVVADATRHIDDAFELGALGTGRLAFYERLGWVTWRGPTGVRTTDGVIRTTEDDGYVMVRITPATPPLDLDAPITCDARAGDAW